MCYKLYLNNNGIGVNGYIKIDGRDKQLHSVTFDENNFIDYVAYWNEGSVHHVSIEDVDICTHPWSYMEKTK